MRLQRVIALLGVLLLHAFGALVWFAFLGFSSDVGTDRQFKVAIAFGAATWLYAALLLVWLWRSGKEILIWFIPGAWWIASFLLMIAIVY